MDALSAVLELPAAVKYSSIGVRLPPAFLLKEQKHEEELPRCRLEDKQDWELQSKTGNGGVSSHEFGHWNNVKKNKEKEGKDTVKPDAIKEPFGADRGLQFFYYRRCPKGECEGGAREHLRVA